MLEACLDSGSSRWRDALLGAGASELGWLAFLGDSLQRHNFVQFAASFCGGSLHTLRTLGIDPATGAELLNQSNYHSSRFFCVNLRSENCTDAWVAPDRDVCSTTRVHAVCGRLRQADTLCVSFDWAPTWTKVYERLRRARDELYWYPFRSSCAWPPRGIVVNPGLHEIVDKYAGGVSRAVARARVYVPATVALLRRAGVRSLTVQLTARVQRARLRTRPFGRNVNWYRPEGVSNDEVHEYNGVVRDAFAHAVKTDEACRLCVTMFDAFTLTTRLEASNASRTRDGVHWDGAYHALALRAIAARVCAMASTMASRPGADRAQCSSAHSSGTAASSDAHISSATPSDSWRHAAGAVTPTAAPRIALLMHTSVAGAFFAVVVAFGCRFGCRLRVRRGDFVAAWNASRPNSAPRSHVWPRRGLLQLGRPLLSPVLLTVAVTSLPLLLPYALTARFGCNSQGLCAVLGTPIDGCSIVASMVLVACATIAALSTILRHLSTLCADRVRLKALGKTFLAVDQPDVLDRGEARGEANVAAVGRRGATEVEKEEEEMVADATAEATVEATVEVTVEATEAGVRVGAVRAEATGAAMEEDGGATTHVMLVASC